jgi:hypothetical protein
MSSSLDNLPSRGLFTSARSGPRGAPAPYLALHDTTPLHAVRCDDTHVLIRSLATKKEREERERKSGAGPSEAAAAKRQKLAQELQAGPALTEAAVRTFTVEKLKAALAQRKLVQSGTKEVLLERLLAALRKESASKPSAA